MRVSSSGQPGRDGAAGRARATRDLLATYGTAVLTVAARQSRTYVACLRNVGAQAQRLSVEHDRVLLLAGTARGEFREEDRLRFGRLARLMLEAGYEPRDVFVEGLVKHWGSAPDDAFLGGRRVQYLQETGQMRDLEFILAHVDHLDRTFELSAGEVVEGGPA